MWGYDVLLSHGLSSIPGFQQDFGVVDGDGGGFVVERKWQVLFSTTPYIGGIFGSIIAGYAADRWGTKNPLATTCIISTGAIFIQIFSEDAVTFLIGKLVHGVCLGIFLPISSSYAAETSPPELRFLTCSSVQLSITIGHLLATISLKLFGTGTFPIAYKNPLTIPLLFPLILLSGIKFCPESPVFLFRRGDTERCSIVLTRLGFPDPEAKIVDMYAAGESQGMEAVPVAAGSQQRGNENELVAKGTLGFGYLQLFLGKNDRRRTEISVGVFIVAQLLRAVFATGCSSIFFETGFFTSDALTRSTIAFSSSSTSSPTLGNTHSLAIGVAALSTLAVIVSWLTIYNFHPVTGRRSLLLFGTAVLIVLLLLIGILDFVPNQNSKALLFGQSICVILSSFAYFATVGPTSWVMFAEIPSASSRSRTCGLAVAVMSVMGIFWNIAVPLLIDPNNANLTGKIGLIFAATAILSLIWIYYRVPETSNLSFPNMDILFRDRVPARKFGSYQFFGNGSGESA